MKDKVTLIKENGDIIGFRINDREFYSDENGLVEVQMKELKGFNIGSIPNGFCLRPLEDDTAIFEGQISSEKEHVGVAYMELHVYRKYWDHKFGAFQYVKTMTKAIDIRKKSNNDVEFVEIEDDGAHIFFRYNIFLLEDMLIDKAFQRFQEIV
ncbi:hypothetical protein MUP77_18425, partial [Candidatus Bathyarchaeota archaeon]|nr:hypothetical protein [Candidatus Bathyarchaeota archaeon]